MKGDVYIHKADMCLRMVEITKGSDTGRYFRYLNTITGKFEDVKLCDEEIISEKNYNEECQSIAERPCVESK